MAVTRIFDILENYRNFYPDKDDAFAGKENKKWIKFSTLQFLEITYLFSYGLLELGFERGDKIATILNNRPEWNVIDHGMLQAGIIHVPIYPTISEEDIRYILNHSDVKAIIISDKLILKKVKSIVEKTPTIKQIFAVETTDTIKNWNEIIELGRKCEQKNKEKLNSIKNSIRPEDLATLIYTSGTTGVPKGVMLSHHNLVTNFLETSKLLPITSKEKVLSFLPLCHVYERMMNYNFQYSGVAIYYAESMGTIAENLKEIQPHGFNSVPRLLEKFYSKIVSMGKDLPRLKKMIFFWAHDLGVKYELNGANGWWYEFKLSIARKLVFKKWQQGLGGNIRFIVSGGAALQPRLERIFHAAGIPIIGGYGLTESSPVIAVNNYTWPNKKLGSVGPVLNGVEVKIANDGEILCKGPNVMMGYYKEPGLTEEIISKDGWLHTGDIGCIEDEKFLKITDRKKEIFKISSGKYIAPQVLENKFKESNFIEQIMVIGENQKFASALISPNFNYLHFWASKHKVHYRDHDDLVKNPAVIARLQKEVSNFNKTSGLTEHIKRFRLVGDEWTPQTGELSPTLKLKRKFIRAKYKDIVDEIYKYDKDVD